MCFVYFVWVLWFRCVLCFEINALCFQCVCCVFDLCVEFCDMYVVFCTYGPEYLAEEVLTKKLKSYGLKWTGWFLHFTLISLFLWKTVLFKLDSNDERDLFALHYVYEQAIQAPLSEYIFRWNYYHGLRTMRSISPLALWYWGLVPFGVNNMEAGDVSMYSINPNGPVYIILFKYKTQEGKSKTYIMVHTDFFNINSRTFQG